MLLCLLPANALTPAPFACDGCSGTGGGTNSNSAFGLGGEEIYIEMVAVINSGECHVKDNMCETKEPCPIELTGNYKSNTPVKVELCRNGMGTCWTSGTLPAANAWTVAGRNNDPLDCGNIISPSARVFIPGIMLSASVTTTLTCDPCED